MRKHTLMWICKLSRGYKSGVFVIFFCLKSKLLRAFPRDNLFIYIVLYIFLTSYFLSHFCWKGHQFAKKIKIILDILRIVRYIYIYNFISHDQSLIYYHQIIIYAMCVRQETRCSTENEAIPLDDKLLHLVPHFSW